jgi:hypothetical protein
MGCREMKNVPIWTYIKELEDVAKTDSTTAIRRKV